jgi:hypothetical protein
MLFQPDDAAEVQVDRVSDGLDIDVSWDDRHVIVVKVRHRLVAVEEAGAGDFNGMVVPVGREPGVPLTDEILAGRIGFICVTHGPLPSSKMSRVFAAACRFAARVARCSF